MDSGEARTLLGKEIARLRKQSYDELRRRVDAPETIGIEAGPDRRYQVEIQAFWDQRKDGDLRVLVSIDDGGLRAFAPMSGDFIVAPDGSFVGE